MVGIGGIGFLSQTGRRLAIQHTAVRTQENRHIQFRIALQHADRHFGSSQDFPEHAQLRGTQTFRIAAAVETFAMSEYGIAGLRRVRPEPI